DATARIDYDVSQASSNPPMRVDPPKTNGQALSPMPVDPPKTNGRTRPLMPLDELPPLPGPSRTPAVPAESWTPSVDQHARHAHRRRRSQQPGNGNGTWKAAPGKTVPLLPRAEPLPSTPAKTRRRAVTGRIEKGAQRTENLTAQPKSTSV